MDLKRIALLHGAGYAGGEVVRLLAAHPFAELVAVTSRTFADQPIWAAHPALRGTSELVFSEALSDDDLADVDAVLVTAEHGQGVVAVQELWDRGFEGAIVDLSADFRFKDAALYERWFGYVHPLPEQLSSFTYGLPEVHAPYGPDVRLVANPGCFATGITLALWPIAQHVDTFHAAVTALTGASGSGARPKPTTHFPTRDGSVRAYKVFAHQHLPEIQQTLGAGADVAFVPASGPWTRGIWGTAQVTLPEGTSEADVRGWFESAYAEAPCVRLWPDVLPELRFAAHTPFCDVGWVVDGPRLKGGAGCRLVVGFALDNLLKGAASQAVENLNLVLGLPQTSGLLPQPQPQPALAG